MPQSSPAGRGKTIQALDLETNYHEAGSGPPVILLHGSGAGVSAWTNWRRVIPALASDFRVIAPDIAGFGYTERKPETVYDMKLWVRHLLAFMDALGIARASLVGNSFGGSVALAAAARFPDRFDRLVLMGAPCGKFTMTPGLASSWDFTPSLENMRQVAAHFPYDPAVVTDELVAERYQTSLIPGAQEALRKLLAKPNSDGETELSGLPESVVATIAHPLLVLHGRDDKVVPPELGHRIARAAPNADLHIFARCGHWVQAERFEDFVALTKRHLAADAS